MTTAQIKLPVASRACPAGETAKVTHSSAGKFLQGQITKLIRAWKTRQQQRIDRDAFNNLLRLSERELADIGLRREDILWASKLPLSYNASEELRKLG